MAHDRLTYMIESRVGKPRPKNPVEDPQQPRKPDWLMLLVIGLFLLTLLIAWLTDVPVMFR